MSMSLPTPPRTTNKDKENQPPTPLTPSHSNPRTPRIIWSQENLHHTYTAQIRQLPSSSLAQGPQKSILKKPSLPFTPLMPPEQPAREITPEPAEPLHHPLFLNSPVSTLVASLRPGMDVEITLTDLTEAYSVLSARLKTKTHIMLDMCGPIPALEPLKEYNAELVKAFHRDIGRAFVDPQSSLSPPNDSPWSTPSSVGSVKRRGFTDEEVKHARDLCNLSHAAMRCFSNISVVPILTSIFTDEQLGDMLTDVLAIPLAPSLPTPNARKTCQIAMWTLQVQRLPETVLAPAADRITYALRRGIDGELGREGKKGAASDGLKAVATLVSYQPAVFLPPFAEILPSVFVCLTCQNLTLRTQAAHAILSLSHALSHLPTPSASLVATLSQTTTNYVDEQRKARNAPQDFSPLGKALSVCINAGTPAHPAQSPMWALSVIAAMIVLSGADALLHPRTIKFLLGQLQIAMAVKRTTVRATTGLVWRALIWACVQLDKGDEMDEKKDSGWRVVRQIVDGAVGVSLVAALLGQTEPKAERVSHALEVVSAMIRKGGKTCEEAVDILDRFLCGVGSSIEERKEETWVDSKLLAEPLFDGSLLEAEWKNLAIHVKSALTQGVTIRDIRRLREDEVIQHWDVLFAIWKAAVERAPVGEDGEVPSPLLSAWQALLLTQAQLTQGYEHLTSEPAFIAQLTELLKSFLTDQSLEWSLDAAAPSWSSQSLKLGFVRNLWTVARNVFAMPTLARAAELLLFEVLKHDYYLEQNQVRNAWAMLCAELVLAGLPQLVRELWTEKQDYNLESTIRGGLWRVVSHQWVDQAGSWDGAIELLRAPFAHPIEWEFDRDDLDLWVRLVECAFLAASARKISPNTVLDTIAREIGAGYTHKALYSVLPFLLSGIDASASERPSVPQLPSMLLRLTNGVLMSSYPPIDAGVKWMLFAVVKTLAEIVKTTRKELIVELLIHIQDGIVLWIQDERNVFSDQEFNEKILPLYIGSMEALKAVSPSFQTLHALSPLFVSGFSRIPEPALGPSAFKGFWAQTYSLLDHSELDYPEDLKPILRNVQEAMCNSGELFAPGLSSETQTQILGTADLVLSIVPDSLGGELANSHETTNLAVYSPHASSILEHGLVPESLVYPSPRSPSPPLAKEAANNELLLDQAILAEQTGYPPGQSALTDFPANSIHKHVHIFERQLPHVSQPGEPTSENSPSIKQESQCLNMDITVDAGSSQMSSGSSLGKRRRSRVVSRSSKRRKAGPRSGVEIIHISDGEDSEQVARDLSIVVTQTKRRKSNQEQPSQSQKIEEPSTPTSAGQPTMPKFVSKKRMFFEAVEIWRMGEEKLQRHALLGCTPHGSPYKRRAINKTRSESSIQKRREDDMAANLPCSSKRRRISDQPWKKEAVDEWSDESPRENMLFIDSDDINVLETPQHQSDLSVASSQSGRLFASRIISPLPHRSHSVAYDAPSDDTPASSSPLKQVAARHLLRRARTAPAIPTNASSDVSNVPARPRVTRSPSEEFLALEHAHVVVTSGASKMGLHELLEASRMVNGISTALGDQMTKKLSSDDSGPPEA